MNPNWLLPIGLVLGLTLVGLAGASKPLGRLDLWLDHQDSPSTAQANALAPIVNCMNQVDVPWRLAHQAFMTEGAPRTKAPEAYDLYAYSHQDIDALYRLNCPGRITDKLQVLAPDSPLLPATVRYLQVLGPFAALTKDSFMRKMGIGRPLTEAQLDEFARQLAQQSEAYLEASNAVRRLLPALDIEPRSQQLLRLEQRLGRNAHWALLDYMIQARSTVEFVEAGVRQQSLTPDQLAQVTRQLRQTWDARQQYLKTGQPDKNTEQVLYLWQLIAQPGEQYLKALDTLHRDWQQHAEPQRLSDDYHAVTQGYDQMLYHYNKLARSQY
ncbi:DUF3829 domain-containing protein [Pseudomonas protegens]|uniref:DUF3829 domain-containing protein n=1 Tax=Pseudomonas protegens TaxID=380021 RepID=UPI001C6A582B|nr:DUF3829 domain-containing protein [Pseudomonas protegens]QYN04404.1 YiiG family protein [Pseudomonas protegens]UVM13945.1 YiiG family protein [Pseudomonas protegens]